MSILVLCIAAIRQVFSLQNSPKIQMYCISLVIRWSFSFQNNPKNLDLSYRMDLELWDCLGRVKLVL